jgi:starvation-inducible DNA-binding protein
MADKKLLIQTLETALAETYALYLKTQTYHWNVQGAHFYSYHGAFESQYKELAEAVDTLAERLRSLGQMVPASFTYFEKLSHIKTDTLPKDAKGMMEDLIQGHETLAKTLHHTVKAASGAGDVVSEDLAIQRLAFHEKTLWMLRASVA